MRILLIRNLHSPLPARHYGGTERFNHVLLNEFSDEFQVTMVGNAETYHPRARVVALNPCTSNKSWNCRVLERAVADIANQWTHDPYDVVVCSCDQEYAKVILGSTLATELRARVLVICHTHGALIQLPPHPLPNVRYVSISNNQRLHAPAATQWERTIYHGLPLNQYALGEGSGGYLVFLGVMYRHKGAHTAVEIARRARRPLVVAGVPPPPASQDVTTYEAECAYFESELQPLLTEEHVRYIGPVTDAVKQRLLGDALALLMPITWEEPFGLVMIEAMACGCPVIAFEAGSVPEVVTPNRTGFIVRDTDDAVAAVERVTELSRATVRREFEARYDAARMVREYESLLHGWVEAASPRREVAHTDG